MIPSLGAALAAPVAALGLLVPPGGPGAAALGTPPTPSRVPSPAAVGVGSPSAAAWVAPLDGDLRILRDFDPPARPWLPGHRGVDLGADPGDRVRAAGAGTVTFASDLAGRGVVVVLHPDGRRTTYEPVTATVSVGDDVATGDLIGTLGSGDTHCGGFPSCLHWGLRRGFDYLDPMRLIDPGHPVLLPP